jgi:hypothetical protein
LVFALGTADRAFLVLDLSYNVQRFVFRDRHLGGAASHASRLGGGALEQQRVNERLRQVATHMALCDVELL